MSRIDASNQQAGYDPQGQIRRRALGRQDGLAGYSSWSHKVRPAIRTCCGSAAVPRWIPNGPRHAAQQRKHDPCHRSSLPTRKRTWAARSSTGDARARHWPPDVRRDHLHHEQAADQQHDHNAHDGRQPVTTYPEGRVSVLSPEAGSRAGWRSRGSSGRRRKTPKQDQAAY